MLRREKQKETGISYYHTYYAVCERNTIGSKTHVEVLFDSVPWLASDYRNPAADEVVWPPDVSTTRAPAMPTGVIFSFTNAVAYSASRGGTPFL